MSDDGDAVGESGRGRELGLRLVGWGVGAFCLLFVLVGLVALSEAGIAGAIRAIVAITLFIAAAALAIPKTRGYVVRPLSEMSGLQIGGAMVAGLIAVAFIGGTGMIAGMGADTGNESQALDVSTETPEGASMAAEDPSSESSETTETDTSTRTQTASATTAPTAKATATAAPTATATATPMATATRTATATPSPTPRPTPTTTPSPTPTATATPEPSSGSMAMDVIQYTGDGNDNEHPNNEWVQFKNEGGQAVSLSGWTVEDDSDRWSYTFGSVTVEPGDRIRLYTGKGSDTDSEVYWGYERAVWNDTGDVVHLTDDSGELVVRFEYSGNEGGRASPN